MRVLPILLLLVFCVPNALARQGAPASPGGGGGGGVVTAVSGLQKFVSPVERPTTEKELAHLVGAIKAIETRNARWLTPKRRMQIAKAALAASQATGVDSTLLIAIARVESDFRRLQSVHPKCYMRGQRYCMADCGITQHWINGKRSWVLRQCKRVANDYNLSFMGSAKELARHIEWCKAHPKYHQPMQRCVLNRYNGGPAYKTAASCSRRWKTSCPKMCPDFDPARPNESYAARTQCRKRCAKSYRRCWGRSAYWKKVLCFEHGARTGVKARHSCRYIRTLKSIPTYFYPPANVATAEK